MTTQPKTLTGAFKELEEGLKVSESVTISDLPKDLAENLPLNYRTYLPYGKTLKVSIQKQKDSKFTAIYSLVDLKTQKGAS